MSKNFKLLQQTGDAHHLFHTTGESYVAVDTADYELRRGAEIEPQQPKPPEPPVQVMPQHQVKPVSDRTRTVQTKDSRHSISLERIIRREDLKLVQSLFPLGDARAPQIVLFSGVEGDSGAGAICARISEILAARGEAPICVVETNFGSPFLNRYFQLHGRKGFSEVLCEDGPIHDYVHKVGENLWCMPAGLADIGRACSPRLKDRMNELRAMFRHIVIHSPLLYADGPGTAIDFSAEGLVLVVEANSTRRESVLHAMEDAKMLGTPVLGVVLNNRTFPIPDAIYQKL